MSVYLSFQYTFFIHTFVHTYEMSDRYSGRRRRHQTKGDALKKKIDKQRPKTGILSLVLTSSQGPLKNRIVDDRALAKVRKRRRHRRRRRRSMSPIPEMTVALQEFTNFGPMRTMVSQMVTHAGPILGSNSSSLVDEILDDMKPALSPPPFKMMHIDFAKDYVMVDGVVMTVSQAKGRGFIGKDGSTTHKAGQIVTVNS